MTGATSQPNHLLVRLPGPLGDAVMATPALSALRTALPAARITWTGGASALGALEGLPGCDDVMPLMAAHLRGMKRLRRTAQAWRRLGPDAILLFPHAPSAVLAAWRSGARVRVGSGRGGTAPLLTRTVSLPSEGRRLVPRSMVTMYLDLAAPFGAEADGQRPQVVTTPFDEQRAQRRLEALELPPTFFGVNPGAAFGPSKLAPPDVLGAIVRRARDATGAAPLVLCGPGEEALAARVAASIGTGCRSTQEDVPDVGELKALLRRARFLLTVDAGPRHLAEALGTPTVVLMGPTDPRWTEHSRARVIRNEGLDCLGCHEKACPIDHPCMRALPLDRAVEACVEAFREPVEADGARPPALS